MGKNYNIIRQEKIKSEEHFNGLVAHNKREYFSSNIDKSRTHKNITLTPCRYANFSDFVECKKNDIREHNKKHKTKNRMLRKLKNKKTGEREYPSMAQEFIFTHSSGAMSEIESIKYLKLADKFLREWFGDCEVISSIIHLDETTPHLHFDVSYFDTSLGKFRQAELQKEGKTDINNIRKAWQKYLRDTEFRYLAMQDGSVVGDRPHERKASLQVVQLRKELQEKDVLLELFHENTPVDNRFKELYEKDEEKTDSKRIQELEYQLEMSFDKIENLTKIAYSEVEGFGSISYASLYEEQEKQLERLEKTILSLKTALERAEVEISEKNAQIANLERQSPNMRTPTPHPTPFSP